MRPSANYTSTINVILKDYRGDGGRFRTLEKLREQYYTEMNEPDFHKHLRALWHPESSTSAWVIQSGLDDAFDEVKMESKIEYYDLWFMLVILTYRLRNKLYKDMPEGKKPEFFRQWREYGPYNIVEVLRAWPTEKGQPTGENGESADMFPNEAHLAAAKIELVRGLRNLDHPKALVVFDQARLDFQSARSFSKSERFFGLLQSSDIKPMFALQDALNSSRMNNYNRTMRKALDAWSEAHWLSIQNPMRIVFRSWSASIMSRVALHCAHQYRFRELEKLFPQGVLTELTEEQENNLRDRKWRKQLRLHVFADLSRLYDVILGKSARGENEPFQRWIASLDLLLSDKWDSQELRKARAAYSEYILTRYGDKREDRENPLEHLQALAKEHFRRIASDSKEPIKLFKDGEDADELAQKLQSEDFGEKEAASFGMKRNERFFTIEGIKFLFDRCCNDEVVKSKNKTRTAQKEWLETHYSPPDRPFHTLQSQYFPKPCEKKPRIVDFLLWAPGTGEDPPLFPTNKDEHQRILKRLIMTRQTKEIRATQVPLFNYISIELTRLVFAELHSTDLKHGTESAPIYDIVRIQHLENRLLMLVDFITDNVSDSTFDTRILNRIPKWIAFEHGGRTRSGPFVWDWRRRITGMEWTLEDYEECTAKVLNSNHYATRHLLLLISYMLNFRWYEFNTRGKPERWRDYDKDGKTVIVKKEWPRLRQRMTDLLETIDYQVKKNMPVELGSVRYATWEVLTMPKEGLPILSEARGCLSWLKSRLFEDVGRSPQKYPDPGSDRPKHLPLLLFPSPVSNPLEDPGEGDGENQ